MIPAEVFSRNVILYERPRNASVNASPSRPALARTARRRYSLRVGILRSSVLIACTALAVSCAQFAPPIDLPISAQVMVSRVISANVPPRPSDCAIETLTAMPTQPYRELGAIQISDADPNQRDTRVIIDQHACAMGADAVVMSPAQAVSRGGLLDATAIAYASSLARRAAQARATEAAGESPSAAQAQTLEAQELPPAASGESLSNPDSAQPAEESAPLAEQQIGPADAPLPTPAGSPAAASAAPDRKSVV